MTVPPIDLFTPSVHLIWPAARPAAIVPRRRWQCIELDMPSTTMTVTLPCGSRLEKRLEGHRAR
ncbi:hypothetical protein ABZ958_32635 [Streptomyces sp. NPDC046237]|uniref:hypothetical protein n=1 Tax=Streptomyces sp. NPDC046237 TaxID=3154914 RepID=UPI0033DA096F